MPSLPALRVLALVGTVAGTLVAAGLAPAAAADPWFGARVDSAIANGQGPGPAPRGTVSADVDSDGRPDLVTVGQFSMGDVLVARSDGTGRFGAATPIAGTSGTQGLDAGDLDGDGDADLALMSTDQLQIRLGDGAGGFAAGPTYPLTLGGQVHPLVVDVDGDGDQDVVAPTFNAIQTLLNDGTGRFAAGPRSSVPAGAIAAIAVARLDPDARTDLFAVDGFSGTTYALRGTGGGQFVVAGSLYAAGLVPEDVVAIDLDADGYDDAATVGSFSFSLTTGLTDGTGRFRSPVPATYSFAGPGPTSAAVADLDADGRDDLVVSSLANPAQGTLLVLAGDPSGRLRQEGSYATAAFPQNPVPADYDNDGDLATVSPGTISVLPGTAS